MIRYVIWNDRFKVGNEIIDSQHKHLFEIADKLYKLLENDYDAEVVEEIVVECAEYVIFHFNTEEGIMREIGYVDIESHKKIHDAFSSYVSILIGDLTAGKEIDIAYLYSYIMDWLVDHIASQDKKLVSEINSFLENQ